MSADQLRSVAVKTNEHRPSVVINFVVQRMHWTTMDKHCIYVTVKRMISSANQQRAHFCGETRLLFSSKHQRNK
jgi:hypothetical protein